MKSEIVSLTKEMGDLHFEIKSMNQKLKRQEFTESLERTFLSARVNGLERRIQRMKGSIQKREDKTEAIALEVLETKTWNVAALALLTEVDPTIRDHLVGGRKEEQDERQPFFGRFLERPMPEPQLVPSFAFQMLQM